MPIRVKTLHCRHRHVTLRFNALEPRLLLSAFGFSQQNIDVGEAGGHVSMVVADLDGDDDLDFVSDNVWRRNDGFGTFGPTEKFAVASFDGTVLPADINGDGHLDLVAVGEYSIDSRKLSWFENRDGLGNFGPEQPIATIGGRRTSRVLAAGDLDGDGDLDLVEASGGARGSMQWFENIENGGSFTLRQSWDHGASSVVLYDLDRDGDLDLLASPPNANILLLENTDGRGEFVSQTLIKDHGPLILDDVDDNGFVDVLIGGSESPKWYESNGESFALTLRQSFGSDSESVDGVERMSAGDFDNDGDTDLAVVFELSHATPYHNVEWFALDGGQYQARSTLARLIPGPIAPGLVVGDLNGDGAADIIYDSTTSFFDEERGQFGGNVSLVAPHSDRVPSAVKLEDIDGDGDLDAIAANWTSQCHVIVYGPCELWVTWSENLDGRGTFGSRNLIASMEGEVPSLNVTDVDGDGDSDVIAEVFADAEVKSRSHIYWFENLDGRGAFSAANSLGAGPLIDIGDVDNDGKLDMLLDRGRKTELVLDILSPDAFLKPVILGSGEHSVDWKPLLDWDRDGDFDVIAVVTKGFRDFDVVGYDNSGDGESFAQAKRIVSVERDTLWFHDLDGDDDFDLLLSDRGALSWRANIDSMGTFGEAHAIDTDIYFRQAADIDSDGDLDLLVSTLGESVWYENDGNAIFKEIRADLPWDGYYIALGDIDQDGDLDVLQNWAPSSENRGYGLSWWQNRPVGDSDGNGIFDASDLVTALRFGEYEDDLPNNSTFVEGDWNGDGDFDSGDLVYALVAGHYVAGAEITSALAAAIDAAHADDDVNRVYMP